MKCSFLVFIIPLLLTDVCYNSTMMQLVKISRLICYHLYLPPNFFCTFVLRVGVAACEIISHQYRFLCED